MQVSSCEKNFAHFELYVSLTNNEKDKSSIVLHFENVVNQKCKHICFEPQLAEHREKNILHQWYAVFKGGDCRWYFETFPVNYRHKTNM